LTSQSLRLREILARLVEAEVRFVLVGEVLETGGDKR
jgi:hypothetical protein